MKRLLPLLLLVGCGSAAIPELLPLPPVTVSIAPVQSTVAVTTTTTTLPPTTTITVAPTTTVATPPALTLPADVPCQEWLPTAISVGWPNDPEVLQTLGQIMWRESRCQPDACSKSDKGRQCRDYGLIQGNWYAHHEWWTELGIEPQDMFDPATNLRWAYLLYSGREAKGQCGWQPWRLSCK
jgi:hypothetical protein